MKFINISFLIILLLFSGKSDAEEINNIDVIDSLVISSIQNKLDILDDEVFDSLAIDLSELEWEKRNYLRVLIGNLARENSFKVFRNYNPTSSFQGLVLTIDQFTTKIGYSRPYEKSFLGKNYITRMVDIGIRGQFYIARSDEVIQALEKDSTYKDEILYGLITDIENSNYDFCKGKREDYTFWEKIYEPVLVIASVGVVVYLFFTQRT